MSSLYFNFAFFLFLRSCCLTGEYFYSDSQLDVSECLGARKSKEYLAESRRNSSRRVRSGKQELPAKARRISGGPELPEESEPGVAGEANSWNVWNGHVQEHVRYLRYHACFVSATPIQRLIQLTRGG